MATKKKTSLSVKNLKPAPGYIIVEPSELEKQTETGIYLPETHDEQPQYGKVLAVGDDTQKDDQKQTSPAKKGDLVVYKKWGGNEVTIKGQELQFLKFEDVLALVE